ncbi:MAG: DUF7173 family protein [Planctomycetota bacterium]
MPAESDKLSPETAKQLAELANLLTAAKSEEKLAEGKRIEIEERIAALIPGPERGQKTVALPDGRKLTVERGFNYRADCAEIEKLFTTGAVSGEFPPTKVKTTRELDVTGYEWYRTNDPDSFALLAQHVTVTPKKIAVSLKVG